MYANIDILLCGRPNGPHYGYLSVRLHVCPITTPNRSQKSVMFLKTHKFVTEK